MSARNHKTAVSASAGATVTRLTSIVWRQVTLDLNARGNAVIPNLLSRAQCEGVAALYSNDDLFRSRVVMERHGYGRGEYQYFRCPLPAMISLLRTALYPFLAPIANDWNTAMGVDIRYPDKHAEFIARCNAAGQLRPPNSGPRMQSRPEVVPLRQGDAVVFAAHRRPVQGTRRVYRVNLRHGVSRVRSGQRSALGIIFHDAT